MLATPAKRAPYLLIKTISHCSVRFHQILNALLQKEISIEKGADRLKALRDRLISLKHNYPNIVRGETTVIDLTLSNIDNALLAADLNQIQSLHEIYGKNMKVHHERYGRQATELQLGGLEEITSKWLIDYAIDLKLTYIIIVGSRGPKKGLIEKQYFDMLRSKHGVCAGNTPSGGVIYSEMLPEQMNIHYSVLIKDLARDICNQEIGEKMLNNREAMYEDILSRYAEPILATLGKSTEIIPRASLWGRFWKPPAPDQGESVSKCPFHR